MSDTNIPKARQYIERNRSRHGLCLNNHATKGGSPRLWGNARMRVC